MLELLDRACLEAVEEWKHLGIDADAAALMVLDARVHRLIHRCAANPYLAQTLSRYFNLSLRIWYLVLGRLPHLPARVHEHGDLLEAIRERDGERSREVIAAHITTFEQEIRSVL